MTERATVHRFTSNSRGPGQQGHAIRVAHGQLMSCPKCGVKRLNLGGPHAARLTSRGLVDCVGDQVEVGP